MKRAGFVLMAAYGFTHKRSTNKVFEEFLGPIEREAGDGRLYVKKAVNWALRNIGKRNVDLQVEAINAANRLVAAGSTSGRWIAKNTLNELERSDVKILNYPRHLYGS